MRSKANGQPLQSTLGALQKENPILIAQLAYAFCDGICFVMKAPQVCCEDDSELLSSPEET